MTLSIWWIRRDLRLHDNAALLQAAAAGAVLPVFILDPRLLKPEAPRRQEFLFAGLRQLDADLRKRGSHLLLRRGQPLEQLARLLPESGAQSIHALEDYSPYALQRDEAVGRSLPLRLYSGVTVHPPSALRKTDGRPYTVFTPFSKNWKALPFSFAPGTLPDSLAGAPDLPGEEIPTLAHPHGFPPGEAEALRRLDAFLDGPGMDYAEGRNRLDLDGTSALSAYFRFGMLSPRLACQRVLERIQNTAAGPARKSFETWLNELIWREFYSAILYEFPQVLHRAFNPSLRDIPWRNAPEDLRAWQEGRTGYPVVDAAMRQLAATGWMHNRGRMIAASFLVKDLLIDWRKGEAWFMRQLIDGDPAANNGGWQWTAGVGTDAAPYFRIFNPVLQSQKFDPRGAYIRKWLPELARVPDEYIHTPFAMPIELQNRLGVRIGLAYPVPMVEHAAVRGRVLAAFKGSASP